MKWIISLLIFTGIAFAQDIPRPGSYPEKVWDAKAISGTQADSIRGAGYQIGGADLLGLFGKFVSRNDSINIVIYFDYSPDGKNWLKRVPVDTIIVSGTQDTSIAFQYDGYFDSGAQVRPRMVSNATATDTTDVTFWIVPHWLGAGRLF